MSLINHINNNNLEEVKNQNDIINEIYNNLEDKSLGNLDLSLLTTTKEDIVFNKTLFINGILKNGSHQCIDLSNNKIKSLLDKTITDIILPSSLTSIGSAAFYNCTNLALTELSSGIVSIGEYAFYNCTNLALTELPSNLTSVGSSTFCDCSNLILTELPSSLTNIGTNAFRDCDNLKTMKIKSQKLGTGIKIFQSCSNLTKVWISSNCISITASSASSAQFADCPDTLEIYTNATEKLSGWGDYFNRTSSKGSVEAVVHYSVSEAEFDAIVAAQ